MRAVAVTCAFCASITGQLTAQQRPAVVGLERGTTAIGSHVRVLLRGQGTWRSGLEVGYSGVGRIETASFTEALNVDQGFEARTSSTKLWHAGFVARRQWATVLPGAMLYAVGGTGLYMGRTTVDQFRYDGFSRDIRAASTSSRRDWEFGTNLGAGVALQRAGWPAALDLDARFHLLPFSRTSGPRTLLTVSAGLSFF